MSIDGIFIHYLANEFDSELKRAKINKIYQPNPLEIVMQLRNNNKTYQLLLSASLDASRIYLTNQTFENPATPGNFCMLLRKYIERGIITSINQYRNDRLIELCINTFNEMGDNVNYKLILELMGRNSNVILINEENIIIDAIRKLPPSDNNNRYIIPKAKYLYPDQADKLNPFEVLDDTINLDNYQGISKLIVTEINNNYNRSICQFLSQKLKPTIYDLNKKKDCYCFDLIGYKSDNNLYFNTLSEMLDYYYNTYKKTINVTNSDLMKQVKRLLTHQETKLGNLKNDLSLANENIIYKDYGVLLQANLYLVKKGMDQVTVQNYLNNYEEVIIKLDKDLDPSKNLKKIFAKGKKATNAIIEINKQIDKTKEEIRYLEDILSMLEFATNHELEEIKQDLLINSEKFKTKLNKVNKNKKKKIEIQHFNFEDVTIYIGKNNIQNDYLSNKLARNNDYWFHIKDSSGAHIVVSVPNNNDKYEMSEATIRLASNLAAYFSKYSHSSSVPVDYTKVRYLKKIPGSKGYHVTYTNQKTMYIDPDYELIKDYIRK